MKKTNEDKMLEAMCAILEYNKKHIHNINNTHNRELLARKLEEVEPVLSDTEKWQLVRKSVAKNREKSTFNSRKADAVLQTHPGSLKEENARLKAEHPGSLKEENARLKAEHPGSLKEENARLKAELGRLKRKSAALETELDSLKKQDISCIIRLFRKDHERQCSKPYEKVFEAYAQAAQQLAGLADSGMEDEWAEFFYQDGILKTFQKSGTDLEKAEKQAAEYRNRDICPEGLTVGELETTRRELEEQAAGNDIFLWKKLIVEELRTYMASVAETTHGNQPDKDQLQEIARKVRDIFESHGIYMKYQEDLAGYPLLQIKFSRDSNAKFCSPGLFLKQGEEFEQLGEFSGKVKEHCKFQT